MSFSPPIDGFLGYTTGLIARWVLKQSQILFKHMAKKTPAEQLADLIEANPNCHFLIDNDSWDMHRGQKEITDSSKITWSTDWYADSSCYGAGIAEALVILLNRRGFNIKAEAI